LNSGSFACEANVLPLDHTPICDAAVVVVSRLKQDGSSDDDVAWFFFAGAYIQKEGGQANSQTKRRLVLSSFAMLKNRKLTSYG
jgi:hypothetical protein